MTEMGGVRLRTELDRIPLWTGNHVGIKQLAEYMARYLYLPRLRDEQVLLGAIHDGVSNMMWKDETFAYAEAWDDQRQRYQGLRAGQLAHVVIDDRSLLVKSEAAAAQLEAERQATVTTTTMGMGPGVGSGSPSSAGLHPQIPGGSTPAATAPAAPQLRRFHGSVRLDPLRLGKDASRIAKEVVQHLSSIVVSELQVTLDMQVTLPTGASDKLVRDVTENCRTLKFDDYGFEEH